MKTVLLVACSLLIVPTSLTAQKGSKGMTDQQFVDFAAQTDMVEANLGQLAQTAAADQAVKDYAQMLVTDHTNDFQKLKDAASQANLKVPDAIDSEHDKAIIAPFHKLKGAEFDRRYIAEMIAGHTKAIAIYRAEASDAKNDSLKSYATEALPVLEKHLSGAKDLEKKKPSSK
jgi:putative membrane protein